MYIRCAQCFVVMEDGRVGALNDLIFFVIESRREKFIFNLCFIRRTETQGAELQVYRAVPASIVVPDSFGEVNDTR